MHGDSGYPLVVGMVGYPNVGKSSTINALYGSKKTAVAPTPGKTKHFQTLYVAPGLCLCDCPGLVLPRFARSKAEMVAAGVLPIDHLTDIHSAVAVVCSRITLTDLEEFYSIHVKRSTLDVAAGETCRGWSVAPAELLGALARARGWLASSGLPDMTRTGR